MNREKLLVAVWKEKLKYSQSISTAKEIIQMSERENWPFQVALAPNPFSYVGVSEITSNSHIKLCSQNVLWNASSGSYIAETTIEMLQEIGCNYIMVGHSERRLHFGETNDMIAKRALAAIEAKICPVLCIGDTADDKDAKRTNEVITEQLRVFLENIPDHISEKDFMIAYEPVWAISTWRNSYKLPDGKEVQKIHSLLRELISEIKDSDFASKISLLYGGSVAPDNAEEYMSQQDVDGALIGGASKTSDSFVRTLKAAKLGFQKKENIQKNHFPNSLQEHQGI